MKLLILALATLLSIPVHAQIHFGTSYEYKKAKIFKKVNDNYHNNILSQNPEEGFRQCQADHTTILEIVRTQHKKNIAGYLAKLNEASISREYDGLAKSMLEDELTKSIVHYMIISEMKKELARKKLTDKVVFEMNYSDVNVDSYFNEALKAASQYKHTRSIPNWLIDEVKTELISKLGSNLFQSAAKVVVNGVAIEFGKNLIARQVTMEAFKAGLKSSVIKFSGRVLASAGRGFLLDVFTAFLKGNRPAPDAMWLDLMEEYPGIMVNPELMSQGGIKDDAWVTHCNTINRRAYSFERRIEKLKTSLDQEFDSKIRLVDYLNETKQSEYDSPMDNTYVAPRFLLSK